MGTVVVDLVNCGTTVVVDWDNCGTTVVEDWDNCGITIVVDRDNCGTTVVLLGFAVVMASELVIDDEKSVTFLNIASVPRTVGMVGTMIVDWDIVVIVGTNSVVPWAFETFMDNDEIKCDC